MDSSSEAFEAVELLADEFMERQRRGENPSVDEYVDRHPELADEIREVFPALAVIEQIAPGSADLKQSQPSLETPAHVRVSQIGDYRILREVGRGGMGVVYEAEQQSLRRRVALKVLPRQVAGDEKALKRFEQEARAAARMHHTNIVPVFDVGNDDEHVFYAMQLIQGQGLDVVIEELKRLRSERSGAAKPGAPADRSHEFNIAASLAVGRFERQDLVAEARQPENAPSDEYAATIIAETALFDSSSTASAVLPGQSEISSAETDPNRYYRSVAQIGHQTAGALAYAHARGIIHRDIKPSNLLLDTAGVVWITDFGLAKTGDEALTHTGDILGTIRYMSPERFQGRCDVRADVYSLGLTLYEMLVLQPAFSSPDRLKLIEMVSKSEPPTPRSIDPRIPRDLETIVLKSIDKDPRRRYSTAEDMADDLERFIQDEPIHARRISVMERFGRWARRNKGLAASLSTAALLLVVIAIGSVVAAGYYRQAEQRASDDARELSEKGASLEQANAELSRANAATAAEANRAREQERAATVAKDEAVRAQQTLQRELYVADMQEVRQAYNEGAINRVEELLKKYVPRNGDSDLRGWEWYYWWRASHRHTQQYDASPNATPNPDSRTLYDLAVAPDESWIALRRWPSGVAIHDARTLQPLAELDVGSTLLYRTEIAISPDGRYLAVIGNNALVRVWRTADWSESASLQHEREEGRGLTGIAFSPTGLLAAGDSQGRVTFWSVEQQRQEGSPIETGVTVRCLAFSPDGSLLATGNTTTDDNPVAKLRVWNLDTHAVETQLVESAQTASSLAWTERGEDSVLAAGFTDGHVRMWDGATWGERTWLDAGAPVLKLTFSPGGEKLAAATARNNAVHVWETDSGRPITTLKGHSRDVPGVGFTDGGSTVWSASFDGTVKTWNVSQSACFDRLHGAPSSFETEPATLVFGRDSQALWRHEPDGSVHRWDLSTGESHPVFPASESTAGAHPNGRFLLTCRQESGVENQFQVWRMDAADPVLLRDRSIPMADSGGVPDRVTVSGDGSTIAWCRGSNLYRFDFNSRQLLAWTEDEDVIGLGLSNNGLGLAVIRETHDWDMRFWNVSVDPPQPTSTLPGYGPVYDFNGSPDDSYVAVARWTNEVQLFDAARGELLGNLRGHSGPVFTVGFSPDGRFLASGGADGTVRLWDMEHRSLLVTFPAHDHEVTSVAFSPDGGTIASLSKEGETRLWHGGNDSNMRDARYWSWLAQVHEANESRDSALAAWNQAVRLAPDEAKYYLERGHVLLNLEQFPDAEADFYKVLSLGGPVERQAALNRLTLLATWNPLTNLPPAADSSWRFTLEEPAGDWQDPEFDDSNWPAGGPLFQSGGTHPNWPQDRIWLRTEVQLSGPQSERLSFLVLPDNDVTIFVNGSEAATAHWAPGLRYHVVTSDRSLQPGRNEIAVRCVNTGGPGAVHVVPGNKASAEDMTPVLSAALAADPENSNLLRRRFRLNTRLERWHDAALDFEKVTTLDADSGSVRWMRAVTLHAVAVSEGEGRIEDYRRLCNAMIERFRDSRQPNPIEHTIIGCALLPADTTFDQLPVERVYDALSAGTIAEWVTWFECACALHAYRAGNFTAAGELAERALGSASRTWEPVRDEARAMSMVISSLVHSATGRTAEAEEALRRARQLNTARLQHHPDGSIVGSSAIKRNGTILHNPLINEILIREAEAAIGK